VVVVVRTTMAVQARAVRRVQVVVEHPTLQAKPIQAAVAVAVRVVALVLLWLVMRVRRCLQAAQLRKSVAALSIHSQHQPP
jgi:type II secretory pathway component PulL